MINHLLSFCLSPLNAWKKTFFETCVLSKLFDYVFAGIGILSSISQNCGRVSYVFRQAINEFQPEVLKEK